MIKYIIKRILMGLLVLLGVIVITFIVTRVVPSDPAGLLVGENATLEQKAAIEEELGLNDPIVIQFKDYLYDLLHGDQGTSLRTKRNVLGDLKAYIPATMELVVYAMILAVLIGIPLGVISARYKDSAVDHITRFFTISSVSLPTFVVALLLQYIFFGKLGLFPLNGQVDSVVSLIHEVPVVTGWTTIDALPGGDMTLFKNACWHLVLPCLTIAFYPIGTVAKQTRAAMLETLGEDYIVAARSYGLAEKIVLWRYALKNSLSPTITVLAMSFAFTLVNTFLIENIFSWPGIGSYVGNAITSLDGPAIMGSVIFASCVYVVVNLIADLIIAVDPRVRLNK